MSTANVVGYALATALLLMFAWGIRTNVWRGVGVTWPTATIVGLCLVTIPVCIFLERSAVHLLWLFPSIAILVTLMIPLRFPWFVGRLLVAAVTIGLNRNEVLNNTAYVERFRELVAEGLSGQEARAIVEREWAEKAASVNVSSTPSLTDNKTAAP